MVGHQSIVEDMTRYRPKICVPDPKTLSDDIHGSREAT